MINNVNETLIGKKVRFVGKSASEFCELFAPDYDIVGTITDVCGGDIEVEWPKGAMLNDGAFWYTKNELELVEEMTNEEIWEMLKPKMKKNGLKEYHGAFIINGQFVQFTGEDVMPGYNIYNKANIHNAIAIAYRSGYERAMKGRPFKIGEKKKKGGHWEPVDPNNLPKEGTKVRYSRECKDYVDSDEYICINDTGVVKLGGSWFGMTLDNPRGYEWICFDDVEDCLDMWVEDDE